MTESEKAKSLVERFTHNGSVNWEAAKKDALICCDEILKQDYAVGRTTTEAEQIALFWLEVKQEIEKL